MGLFQHTAVLMGSASGFKEQQDFVCGLRAGRHWGIVKARDLIVLHGEDKLGSRSGDSAGSGGATHKVPRDQAAGHSPEPHFGCVSLLLPPAWRQDTQHVTGEYDNTLVTPSVPRAKTLCSAVLLTCHQWVSSVTHSHSVLGVQLLSGETGMKDGNPPPTSAQEQS